MLTFQLAVSTTVL